MLLHEYDPRKNKFMLFNYITSDEYMMLLHTKTAKERKFVLEFIEQKENLRRTASLDGIEAPPVLDLALKEKYTSDSAPLASITTDANGFVSSINTSIFTAFTANDSTTTQFNGYGNADYINDVGTPPTLIACISANSDQSATTNVQLSSAGFMTIDGLQPTNTDHPLERFAIPIFRY